LLGNKHPEISIDSDQICIKCGMVDLAQGQSILNNRVPEILISVRNNMRRIEEQWLRQTGDGASSAAKEKTDGPVGSHSHSAAASSKPGLFVTPHPRVATASLQKMDLPCNVKSAQRVFS